MSARRVNQRERVVGVRASLQVFASVISKAARARNVEFGDWRVAVTRFTRRVIRA